MVGDPYERIIAAKRDLINILSRCLYWECLIIHVC